MLPWRFHILAGLSLLLFVATGALWVRSFGMLYGVGRVSPTGAVVGCFANNGVVYAIITGDSQSPLAAGWYWLSDPQPRDVGEMANHDFLGFYVRLYDPTHRTRFIGVPLWFLALLSFITPCVWYVRRERQRRIAMGLCVRCCFDLRDCKGDHCTECGAPIVTRAEAGAK